MSYMKRHYQDQEMFDYDDYPEPDISSISDQYIDEGYDYDDIVEDYDEYTEDDYVGTERY